MICYAENVKDSIRLGRRGCFLSACFIGSCVGYNCLGCGLRSDKRGSFVCTYSFPPTAFLANFMAVLFLISFKPAVINPILRKRAEKQKNEQEKKQKEIDELILLVDDILKQFDVCDNNAPGINEVLKNLGTFTKDASEEKEYYDELKRMIVAVYAKVRKYDPPQLTSQDGTNIDYYIDAGAYNSLKKFFFKLRSKL